MFSHRREPCRAASTHPGEEGASLVFALVFVIVIFTILTGVLSYAFAANRNTNAYVRDQALHYAGDAALEVAVQMVKENPRLGETGSTAPCNLELPVTGGLDSVHDPARIFAAGARVSVTCFQTPNVGIPKLDGDGGQHYRDVSFDVECRIPNGANVTEPLACAAGNPVVLQLGTARVRYDIDPGYTDPSTGLAAPLDRARVPKIASWEINR